MMVVIQIVEGGKSACRSPHPSQISPAGLRDQAVNLALRAVQPRCCGCNYVWIKCIFLDVFCAKGRKCL